MTDIITRIEKLEPNPTEAIVINFNIDSIDVDNLRILFDDISAKFPNNIVVALPDFISLRSFSKDVLENYISMIAEIIDELQGNHDLLIYDDFKEDK